MKRRRAVDAVVTTVAAAVLLFCYSAVAHADASADDIESRILWSRVAGVSAITAWGIAEWDYFERSPRAVDEGWFGAGTAEGGADKLGHLHFSHFLTQAFGDLYQHWGSPREAAGREAALTSVLVMTSMEIGDSFSERYGFSAQDFAMNLLGALIGYQLYSNSAWRQRLDLRVEYQPDRFTDPFTDYGHSKYLTALKLDGFASLRDTPLAWLELQAGYFARGYGSDTEPDSRRAYVGLGINFSRLFTHLGLLKAAQLFHYLQPPQTTVTAEHELSAQPQGE